MITRNSLLNNYTASGEKKTGFGRVVNDINIKRKKERKSSMYNGCGYKYRRGKMVYVTQGEENIQSKKHLLKCRPLCYDHFFVNKACGYIDDDIHTV